MSSVLITGGAGSVGREVALELSRLGHRVRVLDLPQCDWSVFDGAPGIERVVGSIADADVLSRATAGVDAAVHLAAILPPASERDRALTRRVNVGGTEQLIAALRAANPRAHFIFSSSVCVFGDTSASEPPVTAARPPAPMDIYGESKAVAERAVIASGLPYTILRISGISVPAFLAPPEVWPFARTQRIEYVCRADVAAALVACVGEPRAVGRTLNIAGGATWRMRGAEYVAQINERMGLDAEDGAYLTAPGAFDWYDTTESQALLGYQRTGFEQFLALLDEAIAQALDS